MEDLSISSVHRRLRPDRLVSIKDIARETGVSHYTVSRHSRTSSHVNNSRLKS